MFCSPSHSFVEQSRLIISFAPFENRTTCVPVAQQTARKAKFLSRTFEQLLAVGSDVLADITPGIAYMLCILGMWIWFL